MRRSKRLASKASAELEAPVDAPADVLAVEAPRARTQKIKQEKDEELTKTARKSGTNGDALLLVIKSFPDKMDRWQAAASCALASAFGSTGWKEHLNPFWIHEAQMLFPNNTFLTGPFETKQMKKKAAKISKMSIEHLPQLVPPELVGVARQILLEKQVAAEMQALEETEGHNLNARITLTRALSDYKLNREDSQDLQYLSRLNPQYPLGAPMRLYTVRDIMRKALLKHGGIEGLEEVQHGVAVRKENLHSKHEIELRAALEERDLEFRPKFYICDQFINSSNKPTLQKVLDIMQEMDFYFKHTKYEEFEQDKFKEYGNSNFHDPGDSQKAEISSIAKEKAFSALLKDIGVDGVLAIPNLPVAVRRRVKAIKEQGGVIFEDDDDELDEDGGYINGGFECRRY